VLINQQENGIRRKKIAAKQTGTSLPPQKPFCIVTRRMLKNAAGKGKRTEMESQSEAIKTDVLIIGAGPVGLFAAFEANVIGLT
jgi:hypothetical protein